MCFKKYVSCIKISILVKLKRKLLASDAITTPSLFKYSKQTTSSRSLFSLVTSLLRGEERVESSAGPNLLMCVTTRFKSLTN